MQLNRKNSKQYQVLMNMLETKREKEREKKYRDII